MQVYSQTSTSTTLPRSPSGVSGAEFTHRCAWSAGSRLAAPARHAPATMLATRSGRIVLITGTPRIETSKGVDVDDGGGERLRGFLRQVVPNTASQISVYVFPGELRGIGRRSRVRRAVGVPFKRDRGHGDDRTGREPILEGVVGWLAFCQTEAPAVVVDDDADVIRVVERRGAAIERRFIEVPLWRCDPPDQPRKLTPIGLVAGAAAFRREVELIPPLELGLGWERLLVGLTAADQVPAHGNERLAAFRPECRDDGRGPSAPVAARDDGLVDAQRVHQCHDVEGDHRRLTVSYGAGGEKARRAVAPDIRHDDAVTLGCQQRRDVDVGVNVVRPAVEQHDHGTIDRAGFRIANVQGAGIDLLQRSERRVRPWRAGPGRGARLRVDGIEPAEASGCERHRRGAQETAAELVDLAWHGESPETKGNVESD